MKYQLIVFKKTRGTCKNYVLNEDIGDLLGYICTQNTKRLYLVECSIKLNLQKIYRVSQNSTDKIGRIEGIEDKHFVYGLHGILITKL